MSTSNLAQAGLPEMSNRNTLLSGSLTVGVNVYRSPVPALGGGEPLIVGPVLFDFTVIVNGPTSLDSSPSETVIMIPL